MPPSNTALPTSHVNTCNVLFFDDDPDSLERDHTPHVHGVRIRASRVREDACTDYLYCTERTFQTYVHSLNTDAQLYVAGLCRCGLVEHYDPKAGITCAQLCYWMRHVHKYAEVLLDWDRTLSVVEGLPKGDRANPMHTVHDIQTLFDTYHLCDEYIPTAGDLAEFYFGGATRVALLGVFLTRAYDAGCTIRVLTRNSRAADEGRPLFHELLTACVGCHGSDAAWVQEEIDVQHVPDGVSKLAFYAQLQKAVPA